MSVNNLDQLSLNFPNHQFQSPISTARSQKYRKPAKKEDDKAQLLTQISVKKKQFLQLRRKLSQVQGEALPAYHAYCDLQKKLNRINGNPDGFGMEELKIVDCRSENKTIDESIERVLQIKESGFKLCERLISFITSGDLPDGRLISQIKKELLAERRSYEQQITILINSLESFKSFNDFLTLRPETEVDSEKLDLISIRNPSPEIDSISKVFEEKKEKKEIDELRSTIEMTLEKLNIQVEKLQGQYEHNRDIKNEMKHLRVENNRYSQEFKGAQENFDKKMRCKQAEVDQVKAALKTRFRVIENLKSNNCSLKVEISSLRQEIQEKCLELEKLKETNKNVK